MTELKILIVDDSTTMRKIIRNTLKRIGYRDVIEAENGSIALTRLELNPEINFIISDWNMPEMTGLQLVNRVKATEKWKHLPILMVTTRAVRDDIIKAMKSGVSNYVVKPFTADILKQKIDKIMGF